MTHVVHDCPKAPDGWKEAFERAYGYQGAGLPLNADGHDNCPYCGADTSKMDKLSALEVRKLSGRPNKQL